MVHGVSQKAESVTRKTTTTNQQQPNNTSCACRRFARCFAGSHDAMYAVDFFRLSLPRQIQNTVRTTRATTFNNSCNS